MGTNLMRKMVESSIQDSEGRHQRTKSPCGQLFELTLQRVFDGKTDTNLSRKMVLSSIQDSEGRHLLTKKSLLSAFW